MNTAACRPRRLYCAGFSEADRASLCSLLGLLAPYLRPPWELVDAPAQADLCLVRLDGDVPLAVSHPRLAGCALHPRKFAAGTLHRPLRAPQLLALLTATGEELSATASGKGSDRSTHAVPAFRLLAWPLNAECGPRLRLHVLAALSTGPATVDALAARIGASVQEVTGFIEPLCRDGLLVAEAQAAASASLSPPAASGWRAFMAGLGRRLGFSFP